MVQLAGWPRSEKVWSLILSQATSCPSSFLKHGRRLQIDISFIRVCVNRKLRGDRPTNLK